MKALFIVGFKYGSIPYHAIYQKINGAYNVTKLELLTDEKLEISYKSFMKNKRDLNKEIDRITPLCLTDEKMRNNKRQYHSLLLSIQKMINMLKNEKKRRLKK